MARFRLAPLTPKPTASVVSRPVTISLPSRVKAPLTPTNRYTSLRLTVNNEAFVRLMTPSLMARPDCWVISKRPAASTKPPMSRSRLPLTDRSSVLSIPAKPLTVPSTVSASQSSLVASLAAMLYSRSRSRMFSAKLLGRPYTVIRPTCAATPVQLRVPSAGSSLAMARFRLAPLTPKPTASVVSRPVTISLPSRVKSPLMPTNRSTLLTLNVSNEAFVRLMTPSSMVRFVCWLISKLPAASTKPLMPRSRLPPTSKSMVLDRLTSSVLLNWLTPAQFILVSSVAASLYSRSSSRT